MAIINNIIPKIICNNKNHIIQVIFNTLFLLNWIIDRLYSKLNKKTNNKSKVLNFNYYYFICIYLY